MELEANHRLSEVWRGEEGSKDDGRFGLIVEKQKSIQSSRTGKEFVTGRNCPNGGRRTNSVGESESEHTKGDEKS